MFIANDQVRVFRGTRIDESGDEVDTDRPVHRGVPISILETKTRFLSPETGRVAQVGMLEGLVYPNVDVRKGDRLESELDSRQYVVDAVISSSMPALATPKQLALRHFGE